MYYEPKLNTLTTSPLCNDPLLPHFGYQMSAKTDVHAIVKSHKKRNIIEFQIFKIVPYMVPLMSCQSLMDNKHIWLSRLCAFLFQHLGWCYNDTDI